MIRIEPEIIRRAKPNGIGVLVLGEGFGIPRYRAGTLSHCPWGAAVPLIVESAIVRPAWFLRWGMKANVAYVHAWPQRDTKGLNAAVQVLVIQAVLIVPDSLRRICHFVTQQPDSVIARIRLVLGYCRASSCPSLDGRLHSHGRCGGCKGITVAAAADSEPPVRGVVIHVALPWM